MYRFIHTETDGIESRRCEDIEDERSREGERLRAVACVDCSWVTNQDRGV